MGTPTLSSLLLNKPARLGAGEHAGLYGDRQQVRDLATTLAALRSNLEGELSEAERGDIFRQVDLVVATLGRLSRGTLSADEARAVAQSLGELLAGVDIEKFGRAVADTQSAAISLFDEREVVADALRERLVAQTLVDRMPIGTAGATVLPKIRISTAERVVAEVTGTEDGLGQVLMMQEVSQVIDSLQPRGRVSAFFNGPKKDSKNIEIKLSNGVSIKIATGYKTTGYIIRDHTGVPDSLSVHIRFTFNYARHPLNAQSQFIQLCQYALANLRRDEKPLPPGGRNDKWVSRQNGSVFHLELTRGQESHYMEWLTFFLEAHKEIFTFDPATTP